MRHAWHDREFVIYTVILALSKTEGTLHPFYVKRQVTPGVNLEFLRPLTDFTEETVEETL